jgi:uridine monophosphate synthetase
MVMNNTSSFLKSLVDIECVKFGDFTLKSGKKSPIYIDLRNIVSYPKMLAELSVFFETHISKEIQRICGVPYAALPMATAVSINTNLPMLIKRKEAKNYGTKKIVEGEFKKGDKVLLIEDVITSGESLLETITELESEGLAIEQILVVLDREQGGSDRLKAKGYEVQSLFTISSLIKILFEDGKIEEKLYHDVLNFIHDSQITTPVVKSKKKLAKTHPNAIGQQLLNIAHAKKSNLIASVDLTTSKEVLDFLAKVGSGICAVKLHVDIITDFSHDFVLELKSIAQKHNFLIIEDRKFADIGNTQLLQLSKGIYSIASWADMVTIHLIAGEASLKAIQDWDTDKKPGLIPIIEMSSQGALTDKHYMDNCKKFMYKYSDVLGGVCQTFEIDTPFLKFTPGVNLASKGDDKGQQYNTPEFVIETLRSDFLIIGRGLYASTQPEVEIEKYLAAVRSCDIY